MEQYSIKSIGIVKADGEGFRIELEKEYAPAMAGLEGFSHLNILWWFSDCDTYVARSTLQEQSPYKSAPPILGTFATRSPMRPNPIALSCVAVTYIDAANATVGIAYTDANDGTPILDIKPYTPSLDRVEQPQTPEWCADWPKSYEASGIFDWEAEFNF